MRHLHLIGIGAGSPDHLTLEAVEAMAATDVFFAIDKGSATSDLMGVREQMCRRHATPGAHRWVQIPEPERDRDPADYDAEVRRWHAARADRIEAAIVDELPEDGVGAFLVWGDPSLYDSTLRIVDDLLDRQNVTFEHHVHPGITSISALAAAHKVALHRIGESMVTTTGRRLAADGGWPEGVANAIVMLDADCSFRHLDPTGIEIWWGAYLGTDAQILRHGPLAEVAEEIQAVRAAARAEHGWIMDIYLLRRPA